MPPGISREIILLLIPTTIHHHMKLQLASTYILLSVLHRIPLILPPSFTDPHWSIQTFDQTPHIFCRSILKVQYSSCPHLSTSEWELRSSITHHPSCRCLWRPWRARLAHSRLRAVTPWRCSWLNSMTKMVISLLMIITQLNYTGWNILIDSCASLLHHYYLTHNWKWWCKL
jgi:hypothetical protein